MTGEERLANAHAHEQAVRAELSARGLVIEPFGQALLSESVRAMLQTTRTLLRWLPDLIGWRPLKPRPFLIDAKHCIGGSKTPFHSFEIRALLAARIIGLPVIYVCDEYRALLAEEPFNGVDGGCCDECWRLANTGLLGGSVPDRCPEHARRGGRGSGTPYVLIKRTRCVGLDKLFGAVAGPGEVG